MLAKSFILSGERGGNRTFNLLIKSQLLCQLSYAPALESVPIPAPEYHFSLHGSQSTLNPT